jgi:arylformamidase
MRYLDYDQAGLDAQYQLRERHPEFQTYFDAWDARSRAARERLDCRLDLRYGEAPKETLDIFPAAAPNAPVHIFIHGGYWQNLDKKDYSYLAEALVAADITVVVVNYDLAPAVDIDEIVRQNRAALAWVWRCASDFGADRDRLSVSGHSAGGHLATMLLATDWPSFATGMPVAPIKGVCAISGIHDIEPIRLSYQNQVLNLDERAVARNSPIHNLPVAPCPLVLVYGAEETAEFARQTVAYAEAWRSRGFDCGVLVVADRNHFNVIDDLAEPGSALARAVIGLASVA